jgi:hypothetical protein
LDTFTIEQIDNMKHAIGFVQKKVIRGKYEAYRNYYTTSKPHDGWETLVEGGYADKTPFPQGVGDNPMMYSVTKKGIEALEKILGIRIVEVE